MPFESIGDYIVETLLHLDLKNVFGVPGHQTLPYYDAISRRSTDITHNLLRTECNAGYAADGYSRVTNKLGVVDATYGPGLERIIPAISEAYASSVPILVITSDVDLGLIPTKTDRSSASQGVDQVALMKPITKKQILLTDPNKIGDSLRYAINSAMTGRPGPVMLDVPNNLFWKQFNESERKDLERDFYVNNVYRHYPPYRTIPQKSDIDNLASLLSKAKRPIIIAGGGIYISQAMRELREFANSYNIPVVTTISGKGTLPENNKLSLGVIGYLGSWSSANRALEKADLILAVGTKLGQYSTGNWTYLNNKTVVRIDVDESEFERQFKEEISLLGDAKATLAKLNSALKSIKRTYEWSNDLKDLIYQREKEMIQKEKSEMFISTMLELNRIISAKDIIVTDASSSSGIASAYINHADGHFRNFIAPRGMGGLGYGLPAGIGAAVASNEIGEGKVIVVSGDGGFGYTISELETLHRLNIPVKVIVLNDNALGWIKAEQTKFFQKRFISSEFTRIDFEKLGSVFGLNSYSVQKRTELASTLKEVFKDNDPAIVEVKGATYVPFEGLDL